MYFPYHTKFTVSLLGSSKLESSSIPAKDASICATELTKKNTLSVYIVLIISYKCVKFEFNTLERTLGLSKLLVMDENTFRFSRCDRSTQYSPQCCVVEWPGQVLT